MKTFDEKNKETIEKMGQDPQLKKVTKAWFDEATKHEYSYHFKWMGRPVIQFPQDIMAMQEIIWEVKPDLIIETGIAHGGSLIFSASMLELLGGDGMVLGIDIDIREHNRKAIEEHPMFKRIDMIQGSSIDKEIVEKVYKYAEGKKRILLILDSNHTHDHAFQEMKLYSKLVSKGSYMLVYDTVIEDLTPEAIVDRPWGKGNNPKTAVWEFLKGNDQFVIDKEIENKLLITVAPDGYLKKIK